MFKQLFQKLLGTGRNRPYRRSVCHFKARLYLEVLEDRTVPSLNNPLLNFNGGNDPGVSPGDSTGDVGPNHFIEAFNGSAATKITVFNKTTGAPVAGFTDIDMNSLVSGVTPGLGDPIVLYDQLANRWLLAEIGPSQTGDLSIFISNTSDPTSGGWTHYTINMPNFPDYPKISVWQNAYYVTTNEDPNGTPVYALNRTKMLAGLALGANDVQRLAAPELAGFGFQAFTPADNDGAAAPPGAPAYFMRHRDDEAHNVGANNPTRDFLEVWQFTVNFTTPASSSLTQVANIPISEFSSDLNGLSGFQTFPQPNGQLLDSVREVIMNRLQYRNFGTYQVMVGNFVTDVGDFNDHGGVRWFEVRKVGAGPWTLYQEGTIAPDANNRWMGAIAMDGAGDIALGYSIASPTVFPGLRYVGRTAADVLGTMPNGEHVLVNGASSQTGVDRWGDYFNMVVDPVDDRTFWYVGSYMPAGGSWGTRIGKFIFADTQITRNAAGGLVVTDIAIGGKNDNLTITADFPNSRWVINDPGTQLEVAITGASGSGTNTVFVPFAAVPGNQITFNTLGSTDMLTVDFSGGNPVPTGGINYKGGIGSDTLRMQGNNVTTWQINGADTGVVSKVTYTAVENLAGGSGTDDFQFKAAGSVSGTITGGAGSEWLDYSLLTTPVSVNLQTGAATKVKGGALGGVINVRNVLGSAYGYNKLVGSNLGSILVGRGKGNTLTAGSGPSILIGGYGQNTINGGTADDLLIDGRTIYDANLAALTALYAEWQSADPLPTRITNLQNGTGLTQGNKLVVNSTVFLSPRIQGLQLSISVSNSSKLKGAGGNNWFLTSNGIISDFTAGDVKTP